MSKKENESIDFFSSSYIDSLSTHLKLIETAIDEETKWREANSDAQANSWKQHKKQLEEIVKSIAKKL